MKWFLLRIALLVTGMATIAIAFAGNAPGKQPVKEEKEKLKGDWIMTSAECSGVIAEFLGQVPEPEKIKIVTFSNDEMRLKIDGDAGRPWPYLLDPTSAPKSLDLTIRYAIRKKATAHGIYELANNHLKMYFSDFGEARPSRFPKGPDEKGQRALLVLRRLGADPKRDILDRNKAKNAQNLLDLAGIVDFYLTEKRSYPPVAIYSKDGKPLLSWRVAFLKYLDEQLLKEFKLDEPWYGPHNNKLIKKMPAVYKLPGVETDEPGMTFYQVFTGKGTLFAEKEGLKWRDYLSKARGDGRHLMIVEAGTPVPWTKPEDLPYDPHKALPKLGRLSEEGFQAVFADRSQGVQFIPRSTPEKKLRSMIQWQAIAESEKDKKH